MAELMRVFHVAHVHGNNFDGYFPGTAVPITLEMTLVNKALVTGTPLLTSYEYPVSNLDMSSKRNRTDLLISFARENDATPLCSHVFTV